MKLSQGTAAFHEVYRTMRPKLVNYLRKFGVCESDIEDLVQDCFMNYLSSGRSLSMESAAAFLVTSARNRAIDLWRKQKVCAADPIESHQDRLHRPTHDGLSIAFFLERLGSHLDALNSRHPSSRTFKMYYQEGKSLHEIAADLGEPLGTISGRVFRMRAQYKKQWRADLEKFEDQLERAGFGT